MATSRPSGLLPGSRYSEFVVTGIAAATDEDRWPVGQARAILLAAAGGKRPDAAAVRGDGTPDCRLTGGDWVEEGLL